MLLRTSAVANNNISINVLAGIARGSDSQGRGLESFELLRDIFLEKEGFPLSIVSIGKVALLAFLVIRMCVKLAETTTVALFNIRNANLWNLSARRVP